MDLNKLETLFKNEPAYRLKQAKDFIFKKLGDNWSDSNLPKEIREKLQQKFPLEIEAKVFLDKKGIAQKSLFKLKDGCVESVLMPHKDGRYTVCVSSQLGCPLGCSFCATGKLGFKRDLSVWEIVYQVLFFSRILKKQEKRVNNIVFMGMGEPFLNYDAVMEAIKILNKSLGISARHISVSTSGIIEGIEKLANQDLQINLAISLHAPNNELRDRLMPINKKYPIEKVLSMASKYIEKTRRRLMIEYVLIKGINDSEENAIELAKILKKYLKHLFFVNLIPCNPMGKFEASDSNAIKDFKEILDDEKITVVQRYEFGRDIKGACGQLAATVKK